MPNKIREEEVKNKFAKAYFNDFDCTRILGDIDFCVSLLDNPIDIFGLQSLLWAEAKKEKNTIATSIVQLILTIGKARTFDTYLPPAFLGSFDIDEIGIIPYNKIHDIFYINDFNWKVTPSNHNTKEFKYILERVTDTLNKEFVVFKLGRDDKEFKKYIKNNFVIGAKNQSKIKIDKNNFTVIYNKWLTSVKPTIDINWDDAKKQNIFDLDFYLADLLSENNDTLQENLFVLLKKDRYILDRKKDSIGLLFRTTEFTDRQKAHNQFWNKYERPPKKEFWDYIENRRDLLVPQDIRERFGSYFTPPEWVELSQKYLAEVFGEDWQDEYYIWDCAAGTGNLLAGFTNKYNIWASTRDQPDVDVMYERIETMNNNSSTGRGANLLHTHVFQFDFLNDAFSKLPPGLLEIINDEEKRRKLLIYINPPYAESNSKKDNKTRSKNHLSAIHTKYSKELNKLAPELFAQFLIRIYFDIPNCNIGNFSTLKLLNGTNSKVFRNNFLAKLRKLFIVPAYTFDNVKGEFPIGFFIWDTFKKEQLEKITSDVYDEKGTLIGNKNFYSNNDELRINDWLNRYKNIKGKEIGVLTADAPDFQNNSFINIQNKKGTRHGIYFSLNQNNLIEACIYFAVRKCIPHTWINHNDQFLYPNSGWENDSEFQTDCLTFVLFDGKNGVQSDGGTNNWIPFTEQEIGAKEKFKSNFMTDFMKGKISAKRQNDLFNKENNQINKSLNFSNQSQNVFAAAKELWKYYHKQPDCNVNASFYDIREYFKGRNESGKMNNTSTDEKYNEYTDLLRFQLKRLASKIEVKVYEYGFLKI